jgi:hypothetical protein
MDGAGPTAVTAQNGAQVNNGPTTALIRSCTANGIGYTGSGWVASSYLLYAGNSTVEACTANGAQVGIYGWEAQLTATGNDLNVEKIGSYGYGILAVDPPSAPPQPFDGTMGIGGGASAKAALPLLIENNTVLFSGPDNTDTIGIEADAGYGASDLALTITGNTVSGFDYGVAVLQGASTPSVFTSAAVNGNTIAGNTTAGLYTGLTYLTVDATCNWWGDVAGPDVAGNPSPGDAVMGDALWYPWLDGDIGGAPACTGMPSVVTADPPAGVEITPCDPCLTIPVNYTNATGETVRGVSVTFELSGELELCGAGIVPTYGTGSWADGFSAGSEVTDQILDLGGGVYTVDRAILGAACGSTASGTLFTVDVTNAASVTGDATGSITVTAVTVRDCANVPLSGLPGGGADVEIDQTAPDPVTDLAASQVKAGNDGDGTTKIQLTWTPPADPDAVNIHIWRKGFGFYPEYDDLGGSVPAATTDPSGDGWTPVATVPATDTSYPDEPPTRDFWYYVAVADDGCNASGVTAPTDGTLNYHLGDVAGAVPGDNKVLTADISALGSGYGTVDGDPYYVADLDVGPTTDYSVDALPTTDNQIQFEDLMMFAINYAQVGKGAPAPTPAAFNEVTLKVLEADEQLSVEIHLAADGSLQGVSVPLRWNAAAVRPVGFDPGGLVAAQNRNGLVLSPMAGTVDAALLGAGEAGLSGEGLLAVVRFRRVGDGEPGIAPGEIIARDARNQEQVISGTVVSGAADALPRRTVLEAAYPNPFNPRTMLRFSLAQPGRVRLAVYSLSGRHVATLVDEEMAAGAHEVPWTGLDAAGVPVSSGTYLVRMVAPEVVQSQRVTLLK